MQLKNSFFCNETMMMKKRSNEKEYAKMIRKMKKRMKINMKSEKMMGFFFFFFLWQEA